MRVAKIALGATFLCWALLPAVGNSQTTRSYLDGYEDTIKSAETIAALGPDAFGEQVNLKDGATSFSVTDVSVPTNSGLRVALGRTLGINARDYDQYVDFVADGELFGNWKLDAPYIHGVFDEATGWVSSMPNPLQRCSADYQHMPPPTRRSLFSSRDYDAAKYWAGNHINIPGQGNEPMLALPADRVRPSDGRTYYATTKSDWRVSCLDTLLNGTGEGFFVVLPDGTKYTFNWISTRKVSALEDTACNANYGCSSGIGMYRREYFIHATRVEDRFGNWVSYSYSATNPRELTRISSSDGAAIDVAYAGGKITSVTAAGRTWMYQYADANRTVLSNVVLPDQSRWSYAYDNIQSVAASGTGLLWRDCDPVLTDQSQPPTLGQSVTLTHPSGLTGTFKFRKINHGTDNTPGGCYDPNPDKFGDEELSEILAAYRIASLYEKTVQGPGVGPLTWSYRYFPSWSWSPTGYVQPDCSLSPCNGTVETHVSAPEGVVTRYVFGNDYWTNVGQLLGVHVGTALATSRSTVTTHVASAAGQPFPDQAGLDPNWRNNRFTTEKIRPVASTVIQQDGRSFNSSVVSFDAIARPTVVRKWSEGSQKYEATTYENNLAKWVLGQPSQVVVSALQGGPGVVTGRTVFNANAVPEYVYGPGTTSAPGALEQSLAYHPDGTLASVTNGRGYATALSDWKRGVPRLIRYPGTPDSPTGATQSAAVDDSGWITSVTDENGFVTVYGYDPMGRQTSVRFPTGDSVAWNDITATYQQVSTPDRGLAAGHWRQTRRQGTRETVTYLDAMWRPVMAVDWDTTDATGQTQSQVIKRYDGQGRLAFQSYPTRNASDFQQTLPGTLSVYDPLGRLRQLVADSELGPLTTTTEYLAGFQTSVTNARNEATLTSYLVFDQPSTDWPSAITHPEGAFTDIARDLLGKPVQMTRRDATSATSLARSWVYNTQQKLCKTIEPETGATFMSYDAAGNLSWSAAGQSDTSSSCNEASVAPGDKVHRAYDARNRVQSLSFADGNGNQTWAYAPDGLPVQVTTLNNEGTTSVVSSYTYNKRRLLTGETLHQPNLYTWSIGYDYSANGDLTRHVSPGLTVDYAPNALGQPTQASSYASAVTYHPSGGMAQFTYGNGIVHTMTRNARGLPERSRDAYGTTSVLDDSYDYDTVGNVAAISDGLVGARGDRTMTYDGLDRLTSVLSPMFGQANYGYDVLDNLRTVKIGTSRDHTYVYDGAWRLSNVTNTVGGATVAGLAYDAQGNLANKNGQLFRFDKGNRLREAANKESYRYDAHGRRVQSISDTLGEIYSFYGQDGVLRYQEDHRRRKATGFVYLNGSLVARVSNPTATLAPPTVSAPASSATGSYTVAWSTVSGATRYRLEESVDNGAWTQVVETTGAGWSPSGKPNGTYRYRARSCSLGCSDYSAIVTVLVELAPTGVPALTAPTYNTGGSYTVQWNAVAMATRYELDEQVNGGPWVQVQNAAETSRGLSGKPSGNYGYRVRACSGGGCAAWSATAVVVVELPPPSVPTLSAPAQGLSGAYVVSWGASSGATAYELQESAGGAAWTVAYSGASLSMSFAGRPAGTYGYRIRACNGAGCTGFSATSNTTVIYPPASAPTLSAPSQGLSGTYTVSWTAVTGAQTYQLEESANGGGWTLAYNAAGTSVGFSAKPSGSYAYRVRACNAAGCSGFSGTSSTAVIYPPSSAPTLSVPSQGPSGNYAVSWTVVSGSATYQLEESANGAGWALVYNAAGTSVAFSTKPAGSYSYRARACNAAGCSGYSATGSTSVIYPPSTAPALSAPAHGISGNYTVSWTAVGGAATYQLEQSASGGGWTLVYNAAGTSAAFSAKPAGSYAYRARACNSAGCGPTSAAITVQSIYPPGQATTPTTPSTNTTGSYSIAWQAVPNASTYRLEESANNGVWSLTYNAAGLSHAVAGKITGSYRYRLSACNSAGCGAYSGIATTQVTIVPQMPANLWVERWIDESSSPNKIVNDVSWSASSGATYYDLQGQFGTNPASIVYSGAGLTWQRFGGGTHTYWVRACNSAGCSNWKGPVSP